MGANIEALTKVAEALVEHETLDGASVARIVDQSRVGPVPRPGAAAAS